MDLRIHVPVEPGFILIRFPRRRQDPVCVGAGSMADVADRMRRPPRAAFDAATASWAIGSEEDSAVPHRLRDVFAILICAPCGCGPACAGRASQG